MIWFTGDTHFGHANIIRYCRRPFRSIEEHDAKLIEAWNERVAPDDEVWHLGDFAWWHWEEARVREVYEQLNGYVHLITGNHDRNEDGDVLPVLRDLFGDRLHDYREIRIGGDGRRKPLSKKGGQRLVLFHYAIRRWQGWYSKEGRASWHLYGHHHQRLESFGLSFDVGVDACGYAPISWEAVKTIAARLSPKKGDPV